MAFEQQKTSQSDALSLSLTKILTFKSQAQFGL